MRRVTILLAAAAAVVAWSLATPALACDGHKAETTAAVAKAEEAKPAPETAAVKAEGEKGGCAHAMAAEAAKVDGVKVEAVKANAEKGGCAKAKGCAKKATAATLAKNDEVKKVEETK